MKTAPTVDPIGQLDSLYDMAVEASSVRRLEDVLDVALRHCLDLTASEFGFIGLVSEDEASMDIVAIQGFHPAKAFYQEHRTIPLRPNLFSMVVMEDRPVRSADAIADPASIGQPRGHPPVKAFLGVPLRLDGNPIGMIGLANRPSLYEEHHERITLTYAGLVAVLVRNAQLYEKVQASNRDLEEQVSQRTVELAAARDDLASKAERLRLALAETVDTQEQERRRIASDMHDGINQLLIGAMLELESGQHRLLAGQVGPAGEAFESARGVLSQVEAEIRRVVNDLHPPILEGLGLDSAIRDLAERFQAFTRVSCAVNVVGRSARLPDRVEIGLYRMTQEALRNVAVHAAAQLVDIEVEYRHGSVRITVADDGGGFDVESARGLATDGHRGLESMRRRINDLEGDWNIISAPEDGTTITAIVPRP